MGIDTQDKPRDLDEGNHVKFKRTSPRNGAEEQTTTNISKKSILSNGTEVFPAQANRNRRKFTRDLGQQAKLWETIENVWPGEWVDGIV